MIQIAFYSFALLTVGSALAVLLTRNVLYAAFFLLLTLLCVAGLFVLASADFLAIAQIMIYVGGVLVLVVFGVMLTSKTTTPAEASNLSPNKIPALNRAGAYSGLIAIAVSGGLFFALYKLLSKARFTLFSRPAGWQSTVNTIGKQLMTEYVLPFEIVGILLLAALVGATYLASPLGKKGSLQK